MKFLERALKHQDKKKSINFKVDLNADTGFIFILFNIAK